MERAHAHQLYDQRLPHLVYEMGSHSFTAPAPEYIAVCHAVEDPDALEWVRAQASEGTPRAAVHMRLAAAMVISLIPHPQPHCLPCSGTSRRSTAPTCTWPYGSCRPLSVASAAGCRSPSLSVGAHGHGVVVLDGGHHGRNKLQKQDQVLVHSQVLPCQCQVVRQPLHGLGMAAGVDGGGGD